MTDRRHAMPEGPAVNPQQAHYEAIHDRYAAHYYDSTSMWYRDREIYRPLLRGIDLNGARVVDLACGSGYNSLSLLRAFPRVRVHGFDISETACADYRKVTGAGATQADLTRPLNDPEQFDHAIVIGGLHHCVLDLEQTLANIARMLRPGGYFMMFEPNSQFALNRVREIWYRRSQFFEAESERPLNHDDVLALASRWFDCVRLRYFGGPAFYLILNSLITGVPLKSKPFLAPPLMALEAAYNLIPGRWAHSSFSAVWRRSKQL